LLHFITQNTLELTFEAKSRIQIQTKMVGIHEVLTSLATAVERQMFEEYVKRKAV
jgi:hypothetical protein